jgi:hypothetical protein
MSILWSTHGITASTIFWFFFRFFFHFWLNSGVLPCLPSLCPLLFCLFWNRERGLQALKRFTCPTKTFIMSILWSTDGITASTIFCFFFYFWINSGLLPCFPSLCPLSNSKIDLPIWKKNFGHRLEKIHWSTIFLCHFHWENIYPKIANTSHLLNTSPLPWWNHRIFFA